MGSVSRVMIRQVARSAIGKANSSPCRPGITWTTSAARWVSGVPGAAPRNAGEAADGAGGSVAAHQVAISDVLGDSFPSNRRLGRRSRRADADEFGAAFHLNAALGQSTAENRFDVGLPDEQQIRKGRVGEVEVGKWHQDVAVSEVQLG
jgi:hypothetical protein